MPRDEQTGKGFLRGIVLEDGGDLVEAFSGKPDLAGGGTRQLGAKRIRRKGEAGEKGTS